jgi:hypothetical protein
MPTTLRAFLLIAAATIAALFVNTPQALAQG